MVALELQLIAEADSPQLKAVAMLYDRAFPASERKPASFLVSATERADYSLFAGIRDEAVVGMALVYRSVEHDFALLEYMAVDEAVRGGGLGAALLADIVQRVAQPLVLEVESIREGEPDADMRARRIDFYRRQGCRALADFTYFMPRVATDLPPPMVLMVHGWHGDAIPGPTLRAWLADIYTHVYVRSTDDARLVRMQQAVAERATFV